MMKEERPPIQRWEEQLKERSIQESDFFDWLLDGCSSDDLRLFGRMLKGRVNIPNRPIPKKQRPYVYNQLTHSKARKAFISLKFAPLFLADLDFNHFSEEKEEKKSEEESFESALQALYKDASLTLWQRAYLAFSRNHYGMMFDLYERAIDTQEEELEEEIEQLTTSNDQLQKEVDEQERRVKRLQKKINRLEKEQSMTLNELKAIEESFESLRQTAHHSEQMWKKERASLTNTYEEKLAALERTISAKEREAVEKKRRERERYVVRGLARQEAEHRLFERWKRLIESRQLTFAEEDLLNFHTCLKTGGLTILAGMSGTGKSQLVQTYRKSLGLSDTHFLFLPVSPSWTEDADMIGFVDSMNGVYRSAETGFLELLLRAERAPEETFIVCLDEMNLARVEHYFSQFLSLLELDASDRQLPLYNPSLAETLSNADDYPPSVQIGDNIRFVGTVNVDDSTHPFSDKVLDRANVMTLQVQPFLDMLALPSERQSIDYTSDPIALHTFRASTETIGLSEEELRFLWALHEQLATLSPHHGIGPRVVRQIDAYLQNIPTFDTDRLPRGRALDLQIVQRVLSKVRGSDDALRPIVGRFDHGELVDSPLLDLFDRYASLSSFEASRAHVTDQARELDRHGYAF